MVTQTGGGRTFRVTVDVHGELTKSLESGAG